MKPSRGDNALDRLRSKWWRIAFADGVFILAVAWLLPFDRLVDRIAWLLPAVGLMAYVLYFIHRRLDLNRRAEGAALLPDFGLGNLLSMGRGLCLILMAGFLTAPRLPGLMAWVPAMLYTLGDILDFFDGYAARVSDHATLLGEALDLELDALGLLLAVTLAVRFGTLPWWFLPIGLARYAYALGLWWRRRRARPEYALPASEARRPVAGLTMGFVSVMLWPITPPDAATLAGTIFLGAFSAIFLRDWLVVSGVLDPESSAYRNARRVLKQRVVPALALLARLTLVASLGELIQRTLVGPAERIASFHNAGFPSPELVALLFLGAEILGGALVAIGAAGRFAAFGLLFPVGFTILAVGLDLWGAARLVAVIGVLLLGCGPLALWEPSGRLFRRRAGELNAP